MHNVESFMQRQNDCKALKNLQLKGEEKGIRFENGTVNLPMSNMYTFTTDKILRFKNVSITHYYIIL